MSTNSFLKIKPRNFKPTKINDYTVCSDNPEMTNLRTDEIVFFRNLTKIDNDENKAIYSMYFDNPPPLKKMNPTNDINMEKGIDTWKIIR